MPVTPEIEHAAKLAAVRVQRMIVEMLASGETGEVAVVVNLFELEPEKRVSTKARRIRVGQGHSVISGIR